MLIGTQGMAVASHLSCWVLLLTRVLARRLERLGSETLRRLLSLELLLLAAVLVLFSTFRVRLGTNSLLAATMCMCGVAAEAVQTALVQIALPMTPSTTAMTTGVTKLVVALVRVPACRLSSSSLRLGCMSRRLPLGEMPWR